MTVGNPLDANLLRLMTPTTDPSSRPGSALGRPGAGAAGDERLRGVAEEFETIFVQQLLKTMRQSLDPERDLLHGGMSQEIFEDMLYDEYAHLIADAGDFGVANAIVSQLGRDE